MLWLGHHTDVEDAVYYISNKSSPFSLSVHYYDMTWHVAPWQNEIVFVNAADDEGSSKCLDATIPKFEPHKFSWAQVGNLTHAMASAHRAMAGQSASEVNMEDYKKFSA